jgi:hypothetical protein
MMAARWRSMCRPRFMLTMFNRRYGKLVSNVKIWSEHFHADAGIHLMNLRNSFGVKPSTFIF